MKYTKVYLILVVLQIKYIFTKVLYDIDPYKIS